ncbi:MAG: pilus assembly PilX N-terminal domain-containing protein [Desulfobacterales bacterium]|nr:MAG: pilus assembly PilX N-terminal domain-containing protein [Desulfobacterales bacterium]
MQKTNSIGYNERGSIAVVALAMLTILTIISFSASNTATTEMHLSTNTLLYERAFYAAESGMEHAVGLLRIPFIQQNNVSLATGSIPDWDFALVGATDSFPTDADGNPVPDGVGDFEGGVTWLASEIDGISYSVTLWNNNDGGSPTDDTDGIIFARSVAVGPRGAVCRIETMLNGNATGQAITGYTAQEGAGSGKSYTSNDSEAMSDFGDQLGSP